MFNIIKGGIISMALLAGLQTFTKHTVSSKKKIKIVRVSNTSKVFHVNIN
jgi:hypothetical protein